mmetsp:Transcript_4635/g.6573  ORF Transcript_4635/g.6573 Transcript_4635/m.6573 type:complete len:240 (+) Transcript_4635:73-792(+)|eukprot:CAMPEP_0184857868 /NCGR_PEP_ID=MMETSP0580-20130426/3013_1 /TAXON_ID=1118495 /ORGANISM="Dactyliosolen fragilissimus" /LENGTH=239 /DNA_ID=CAMNT_0027353713 /DNA_START=5 /DNA_END=724 /DNA_ORIENTATION=+
MKLVPTSIPVLLLLISREYKANGFSPSYGNVFVNKQATGFPKRYQYTSSSRCRSLGLDNETDGDTSPVDVDKDNNIVNDTKFSAELMLRQVNKGKRVLVTIKYTGLPALRPFFLTVAKKIKTANPDIAIQKIILPANEGGVVNENSIFEVLVDNRIVIGKERNKWRSVSRSGSNIASSNNGETNIAHGMSVFVSMEEINAAIAKARRKRRPTTVYAQSVNDDGKTAVRLEMLRGNETTS